MTMYFTYEELCRIVKRRADKRKATAPSPSVNQQSPSAVKPCKNSLFSYRC
ncbi:hypothetical protein RchiOBHm_Chr4g0401611 [Rosa chinensis]|uniref:Uncharacterized protein n=1 Tax=Rosa chinensis TaxID=74649 RepID=A0A2P6QT46_ROSCH|nr:hypothetical protein RchiOBHm_Chr4g0401611 [Rosa chinensis]